MSYSSFDFSKIDPNQAYYHLLAVIAPRPIAWVSSRSAEGVNNLAPFSFFNAFSANPPVVGFAPASKDDGSYKDTYNNIAATGDCVINMVSHDLAEQMNATAKSSEPDEFKIAGLTAIDSQLVKAPRLAEARVQIEASLLEIINFRRDANGKTKLYYNLPAGDTLNGSGNLILCELLCMHVREDLIRDGRIDTVALDLVGRNGADYYTRANESSMFRISR